MANEAFALSPMSARAAEPNEQDYDAIREAFMETARGRWFLGEYAKRNRNADTRMVLDAVAKIEETLAAQRQPVVEDRLPEALVAIRRAVEDAESAAAKAFDPAAIEATLAPIPRGVRIIKEISWRWREIGADGRICDLIDSQLASIEAACAQVSTIDPRGDLKAAFDLLKDRVEQTDASGGVAPQAAAQPAPVPVQPTPTVAETPIAEAPAAMASEAPVAFTETPQEIAPAPEPVVEASGLAEAAMDIAIEPETTESDVAAHESLAAVEDSLATPAAFAEISDEFSLDAAAEAEDEAILDAIALEMGAPDPEFDAIVEPMEMEAPVLEPMPEPVAAAVAAPVAFEAPVAPHVEEPEVEEPVTEAPIAMESLARLTEAIAEAAAEVMEQPAPAMAAATMSAAAPSAALPMPSPLPEPSLGATILASGIVQKPRPAANDGLAPIRRMTQAEKIAFFS
ncbi:hypothetical protein G8O24_08755 [Bradyrhizobium sp. INPA01-394B]|uniref:Uncharacterized protein n=1 Tax=Bradyrhizobium campsiandrae TaxID=1729892 RepID=A0ABR7TZX2_9BRAD|nr:hypothetical protein [Bradyrhizobium campsiandrae]MBC9877435.1 hypothetical protein [Bradyrhizobium campsiandrae]MBC9976846.1 hypothetical protein [Bradyrhizobium campsiandrae]